MRLAQPTNEPIFVPRSGAAAEGDGYVLANIYDANRKASHLVILDAQNLSDGPLATAYGEVYRYELRTSGNQDQPDKNRLLHGLLQLWTPRLYIRQGLGPGLPA